MDNSVDLLKNFTKENHLNFLYRNIAKINFDISPIRSTNWDDSTWLANNEVPFVLLSHLVDSYYCLPERPDMAFTFLWKALNSNYKKIAIKEIVTNPPEVRLTDAKGIEILVNKIHSIKNQQINPTISILNMIEKYVGLIPFKTVKFISNIILKGYCCDGVVSNIYMSSSYFSFKSNHPVIFEKIKNTYGAAYKSITNPTILNYQIQYGITDKRRSQVIPESLAEKIKELLINRSITVSDASNASAYTMSFADDKEYISFIIKIILYSIRNNSVHGNLVSRLNSEYASEDSLKTAIYIYFLGHMFLTLSLYISGDIPLSELDINIANFDKLATALN